MVIKLTLDHYMGKCSKLIRCNVESSSHKIQKELETLKALCPDSHKAEQKAE
jgi:hypothetical protein